MECSSPQHSILKYIVLKCKLKLPTTNAISVTADDCHGTSVVPASSLVYLGGSAGQDRKFLSFERLVYMVWTFEM